MGTRGAGQQTDPNDPRVLAAAKPAATADATFGLRLFRQLAQGASGKNVVYSPESVAAALGMAYEGAGGATRAQMGKVLALNGFANDASRRASRRTLTAALNDPDPKVTLEQANALWVDPAVRLRPAFAALTGDLYGAEATALNLRRDPGGSATKINGWVSDKTHGMISQIVDAGNFNADSALVLTNAVYFHGLWSKPFEKSATDDKPFYSGAGAAGKSVKMMHRTAQMDYLKGAGFQAIRLPFGGKPIAGEEDEMITPARFHLYVILPDVRGGLPGVVTRLNAPSLEQWDRTFRPTRVELSLPRVKASYTSEPDLNAPLKRLGMTLPFVRGADFSKMCDQATYIGWVKHRATIEMDEEGAKAAAATSIGMVATSVRIPEQPKIVNVDHPFLFLIRDDATGATVFVGAIYDPQAARDVT